MVPFGTAPQGDGSVRGQGRLNPTAQVLERAQTQLGTAMFLVDIDRALVPLMTEQGHGRPDHLIRENLQRHSPLMS